MLSKRTTYSDNFKDKNGNKIENAAKFEKHTLLVIFLSLLVDLLAFTMILPLFPSLLDFYRNKDDWLYKSLSNQIKVFQNLVGAPEQFNSVLFGGFLGSMFSFLQFVASPVVGALSDRFGRKPILILTLTGIASSYLLWALSSNMLIFVIARFVGGICKGNISLSMAVITDVSNRTNRGKGMALVGIAFSLGFIMGPLIGAGFTHWTRKQTGNWYIYPALLAFIFAFVDLLFIVTMFKETLPKEKRSKTVVSSFKQIKNLINVSDLFHFRAVENLKINDLKQLNQLGVIYFVYLFIYSGLEFTLTFLTHHTFNYTSMQQGWMFFGIGLIMAVLQGSIVRRLKDSMTEKAAVFGLWLTVPTFLSIGFSSVSRTYLLYVGVSLFALSTAFVVSCLMTIVSHYGGVEQKGTVMGIFRSLGSLARALGPIVASISFWCLGSTVTYCVGAIGLFWPAYKLQKYISNKKMVAKK